MTELSPGTHVVPLAAGRRRRPEPSASSSRAPRCGSSPSTTGQDVGPGEGGEIWIRGPQVMKGYLGRPEETAAMIDADGWLHTGDIGRVDDDGWLFVVDRVKELIKYKGYQVAPAELEAVLLTHPDVADAAVIGVYDEEGNEVPKAFVVRAPGSTATEEDVMAYVAERVAPYKKVRRVEFIDAVPKAASGKILRRELRAKERPRCWVSAPSGASSPSAGASECGVRPPVSSSPGSSPSALSLVCSRSGSVMAVLLDPSVPRLCPATGRATPLSRAERRQAPGAAAPARNRRRAAPRGRRGRWWTAPRR